MKKFPIYWHDLSQDKQDEIRLHPVYNPSLETVQLATIEIEDADITPPDYNGPTTEITLFYRDGANYKYTEKFTVPSARLESVRANRREAFYDQDDALISYDHDLGISRDDFHGTLGTTYNPDYDHNFVIIEEIDGVPNYHVDECIAHSSHGSFTFHPWTGTVITVDLEDSFGAKPKLVDVGEWRTFYKKWEIPEELDILDIGYECTDGEYVEAESTWRFEHLNLKANGE